MAKYEVILKGLANDTQDGYRTFVERFASAYQMDPGQASQWLAQRKGVIFEYDDPGLAEQGKAFLQSIGAYAEIKSQGAPESPTEGAGAVSSEPRPCPKCGNPVPGDQDECPYCHIFISRYEQMMARKKQAEEEAARAAAQPVPSVPTAAEPPKPENFIKSRRSKEDLVNDTAKVYARIFVPFILLSLMLVMAPIAVVALIFVAVGAAAFGIGTSKAPAMGLIIFSTLVIFPAFFYIMELYWCALVKLISEVVAGRKPTVGEILRSLIYWTPVRLAATHLIVGAGFFVALIPAILFAAMKSVFLTVIAILALIPVYVYLGLIGSFVIPVVVVEGLAYMKAIQRIRSLLEFNVWRCFGILFVFSLVISIGVGMFSGPFARTSPELGVVISGILQLLTTPLLQIVIVLLYYELRAGTESFPDAA